ncbi:hypothetical protein BGZ46_000794 [Entomortierella lignicola]|nr:hypothetical protein BGZ46_000794 [Entomortierella lignicola]
MTTTRITNNTETSTAQEDLTVEALRKSLAAVTLELNKTQGKLASAQVEVEAVQSSLAKSHLELQNARDALATSERARLTADLELEEANCHRVHPRPDRQQEEVFVVLRFQQPKPLPDGAYHFLARKRKSVDRVIKSYKAKHSELDAVEILRIEPTARAQNLYMKMKVDVEAPIELSRQNFILKKDYKEDDMIKYIINIFSLYTPVKVTAITA